MTVVNISMKSEVKFVTLLKWEKMIILFQRLRYYNRSISVTKIFIEIFKQKWNFLNFILFNFSTQMKLLRMK